MAHGRVCKEDAASGQEPDRNVVMSADWKQTRSVWDKCCKLVVVLIRGFSLESSGELEKIPVLSLPSPFKTSESESILVSHDVYVISL